MSEPDEVCGLIGTLIAIPTIPVAVVGFVCYGVYLGARKACSGCRRRWRKHKLKQADWKITHCCCGRPAHGPLWRVQAGEDAQSSSSASASAPLMERKVDEPPALSPPLHQLLSNPSGKIVFIATQPYNNSTFGGILTLFLPLRSTGLPSANEADVHGKSGRWSPGGE
ncbi:hypothetical protein BDV19DRAFT_392354 [Aspergillus venezuelensis]